MGRHGVAVRWRSIGRVGDLRWEREGEIAMRRSDRTLTQAPDVPLAKQTDSRSLHEPGHWTLTVATHPLWGSPEGESSRALVQRRLHADRGDSRQSDASTPSARRLAATTERESRTRQHVHRMGSSPPSLHRNQWCRIRIDSGADSPLRRSVRGACRRSAVPTRRSTSTGFVSVISHSLSHPPQYQLRPIEWPWMTCWMFTVRERRQRGHCSGM